ncbi:CYFA0S09e03752g1_1 [Cyberlindnera fabianii]|uniref:CYFA0S09e03752g1_1 n=1 Tax=Cyberlindnera fabianii TaxID=36022 RepID=A0A061B603_CYBFA|nr:CYFA0S09e03752g1_1 [Cyberlindnera fabianii]
MLNPHSSQDAHNLLGRFPLSTNSSSHGTLPTSLSSLLETPTVTAQASAKALSPASEASTPGSSTPSLSSTMGQSKNPHDKKGRSTSCMLCQKRKQKCDHRLPSCTTCIKAGVKCVQPAKYAVKQPEKDDYTIMLEKKVKFLEKILDANNIMIDQHGQIGAKKNFKYKKLSPFLGDQQQQQQQQQPIMNKLVMPTLPVPHGRTLPAISDTLPSKVPVNKHYITLDSVDYTNSLFAKYNLKELFSYDPVFDVDEKLSRAFLDIHFTRLHFKYPLLDEEEIFEFHNAYVTNNLAGYMNDNDHFHYCCARMWMVFAISSCLHMSTGKYRGPPPARYCSTAMRHISKCEALADESKIEILTLTVLYLIRTDKDSSCLYDIIRDAMSLCLKMGLNKSSTYAGLSWRDKLRKLRLWWCVYLLERMISIAVGKPYTLAESSVDEDIPFFEYDSSKSRHPQNASFINQSIKLRRIESRFVSELSISANLDPQQVNKRQIPLVEKYFQELEIWRSRCGAFANGLEDETLRLYYYRSVRLLIQPFLELLDPMDRLFRECQAAAGHICQLFKVFHEKTVFGHSTTAIHTVFVAGVTLIYCLWLARNKDDMKRKALGDVSKHTRPQVSESLFNGLNDLCACSICLYVMTERSKFALIFRDTFDQLMSATIGNLIERCGPDSSEIIYAPGMPPAVLRRSHNHLSYNPTGQERTDEDRMEQAERRRKQGQLQKSAVPKSLSHLLINSPPLKPEEDIQPDQMPPRKKSKIESQFASEAGTPSIPPDFNLSAFAYPSSTHHGSVSAATSTASSISTPQSSIPSELTPFNGGANTMITNISAWSGESGVPITTSLFDHSSYTTKTGGSNNDVVVSSGNGRAVKPGDQNYLWNVPVEEFWNNNEDSAFLT